MLHLTLEDWARRYGDTYCFYLGPRPILVISNAETVRKVLVDRPTTFRRMRKLAVVMRDMKMLGVFAAEGEAWRRQRKLLSPGFQSAHLETFYPSLATITQRLRSLLEREAQQGSAVDILPLLFRYTVDVTSIVSFGSDLDTLQKGPDALHALLEHILPAIQQRLVAPFPYWRMMPSAWRIERTLKQLRKVLQELIDSARSTLEREPERLATPRTLLDAMLAARDEEGGMTHFTDDEVFANVLTLLLAGEDNSAITQTWILYYLALMPAVQARARQEVDEVLGTAVQPTLEHLKKMPYMAGMAQEALRLRSPTPLIYLEANEATVVGDVAVPAGSMVIPLTRLPCLDNSLFGDAEHFRPERWMTPSPPDTQPHHARQMMAFGAGGRVCPGRALSLMEIGTVTGMVLRHFILEVADPTAPVTELNVFSVQPEGVRVRFKPRAAA